MEGKRKFILGIVGATIYFVLMLVSICIKFDIDPKAVGGGLALLLLPIAVGNSVEWIGKTFGNK